MELKYFFDEWRRLLIFLVEWNLDYHCWILLSLIFVDGEGFLFKLETFVFCFCWQSWDFRVTWSLTRVRFLGKVAWKSEPSQKSRDHSRGSAFQAIPSNIAVPHCQRDLVKLRFRILFWFEVQQKFLSHAVTFCEYSTRCSKLSDRECGAAL